jgi:D-glycero-beta-D-manno-heptose-7-phosphate kinase
MTKYLNILRAFKRQHVLVIGDLILDQYIKGTVDRISPEAPVPIVLQKDMFYTPGGAANVANNLSTLGAAVTVVGCVGDDREGHLLRELLKDRHIRTNGVFENRHIHTSLKTRIIAHHQQVVRIDREKSISSDENEFYTKKAALFIRGHFKQFEAVIISDYGKGVIQSALVRDVVSLARKSNIPVVVDPKVEHLKFYGHVTSITPNRKEAEGALKGLEPETRRRYGIISTRLDSLETVKRSGQGLLRHLGIDSLLVTLGEDGMCLFETNKKPVHIPTRTKEVFDVSGAGDTVIAVFALALGTGARKKEAAEIANHAAGIVVGKMGAASVTMDELMQSLKGA